MDEKKAEEGSSTTNDAEPFETGAEIIGHGSCFIGHLITPINEGELYIQKPHSPKFLNLF